MQKYGLFLRSNIDGRIMSPDYLKNALHLGLEFNTNRMKKFLLLIVVALFATSAFSQYGVPRKIKKAFEAKYPDAQDVQKWESDDNRQRKDVEWTVKYQIDGRAMTSTYDYKENWLITLAFIEVDELPDAVVRSVQDEYQGSEIILAAKMQEPGFDGYGVAFMYKKERWGIAITNEGKVMRRKLTASGLDF